ncbi:ABC transporter ATP-binding protein [Crassaminicella indica]|uniref:ABC transporter ATP-binding protein n=1 Tax=Crassaminicella indica TaxID=2855394 RepID=A0ABX8REA8_9CLOT|nr:ABC transporter ATP-binding protein [Crassaminicella indica]QXM07425.1 ABC transporter ATP-binding protein [Crassaminicella indica]
MINIVEIKNVRKVYRVGDEKIVALNDVSLEIKKGEVCCFLGTSGSGKSTLLNMMAGLEKPTKGIIKINGKNVEKMNEKQLAKFRQKYIGFIFQSYNLLPALTALENVSLPLTFRGMKKKEREKISLEMLNAVGLKKYVTHKPTQMSGGQQQRVGIARAFVSKPPIIFADEPTGNLDSKTTHEVMHLMLEIAKENDQTLIIVTHDRSIAEYADKIVYILDGNIEKIEEK